MDERSRKQESYVRKVTDAARQYAEDLLHDNERLRLRIATLEGERLELVDRVQELERELETKRHHAVELDAELSHVAEESRQFHVRFAEVERQSTNLANLYVASYRLHASLDEADVLTALREIISSLVGSEEMVVLELSGEGDSLILLDAVGVDAAPFERVSASGAVLSRVLGRGETYVAEGGPRTGEALGGVPLTACVPLMLDGDSCGAIAIFGLLPQKPCIEAVDREMFELLATHAATALHGARLHRALRGGVPRADGRLGPARARLTAGPSAS